MRYCRVCNSEDVCMKNIHNDQKDDRWWCGGCQSYIPESQVCPTPESLMERGIMTSKGVIIPRNVWLFNPTKYMFEYYNKYGLVSDTMNPSEVAKVLKKHVKTQQRPNKSPN